MSGMSVEAITDYIVTTLSGVDAQVASKEDGSPEIAWGDTFFIYDPLRNLEGADRFPFATIVTKDYGDFDDKSNLDRPGVFRLNIGLDAETYQRMFPADEERDFTALDRVMPHPVYGANHWICVLNPSATTFESLKPLLALAHGRAMRRIERRADRAR